MTFKTLYGIDNISSRTNRYFDPRTNEGNTALGSATGISSKRESYTFTNTLTAEKPLETIPLICYWDKKPKVKQETNLV